jgi:RHS repeat-associated protein
LPGLAGFSFQPGDAVHERGYFAPSARKKLDVQDPGVPKPRGLLLTVRDSLGLDPPPGERGSHDTDIEYDPFDLLPVTVTDPVGLVTVAEYDLRVMQPGLVTDPNRNESEFRFTPLGLVGQVFVRGKTPTEGDQDRPGTRFEYDFMAFEKSPKDERQPVFVRAIRQEHHDTELDMPLPERNAIIETVEYSDGFGRPLQTRTQAEEVLFGDPLFGNDVLPAGQSDAAATLAPVVGRESGPGDPANVVVSGWQIYDNKGRVVEKFEPFFSVGFGYLSPEDERRLFARDVFGQKATTFYDPLGHAVRTLSPDGSEQRVVFGVPGSIAAPDLNTPDIFEPTPWISFTYDANDLAPLSTSPNIGTTLADRAPRHHHYTPSSSAVDALGRTVVAIERNREAPANPSDPLPDIQEFRTQSVYDIRGNLLSVTDALGRTAFQYVYDLANNALRVQNIDAGVRRTVLSAAGIEIERRDKKGALILQAYDVMHRPVRLWARDATREGVALRERLIYGDGADSELSADEARAGNLLGALHRHYDEAGLLEFEAYDFKGNVLEKNRRVIRDDAILQVFPDPTDPSPDWDIRAFRVNWDPLEPQEAAQLDENRYDTSVTHDALNRVKSLRYPRDVLQQRKVLHPQYNRAGALERVALDGDVFVERMAYDAKGQRSFIALGNGVMTRYAYDRHTFRLVRLRSERFSKPAAETPIYQPAGTVLQDFAYEYDLVGNIDRITDRVPGSGIQDNPDALLVADPALRALVSAGDALVRRFTYDPLYRLISATGRICKSISRPRPFDENPPWCGFNSPNHGTPNQDNAPNLTERYQETYIYDRLGNILELKRAGGFSGFTRTFGLADGTNQLTSLTVGNGVSSPSFPYDYDVNGNLVLESSERHFEWDHSDRLKVFRNQIRASDGTLVEPTVHAHYLYDSGGMRVKKLVRKQGGAVELTEYVDDLFEFQRAAGIANNTLHVVDDQIGVATERVGEPFPDDARPPSQYHFGDHLGSSNVVIDQNAQFINREEYTPYGESSSGSFARKRFRFTGNQKDEESGLFYHRARYYLPHAARWATVDPEYTTFSVWSPFCYALANPIRLCDPTGASPDPKQHLETLIHQAELLSEKGAGIATQLATDRLEVKQLGDRARAASKWLTSESLKDFESYEEFQGTRERHNATVKEYVEAERQLKELEAEGRETAKELKKVEKEMKGAKAQKLLRQLPDDLGEAPAAGGPYRSGPTNESLRKRIADRLSNATATVTRVRENLESTLSLPPRAGPSGKGKGGGSKPPTAKAAKQGGRFRSILGWTKKWGARGVRIGGKVLAVLAVAGFLNAVRQGRWLDAAEYLPVVGWFVMGGRWAVKTWREVDAGIEQVRRIRPGGGVGWFPWNPPF